MKGLRVGVLCNGRHVGTEDWEGVVWGRPPKMGQIPKAIQAVIDFEAILLVFGTGASEKKGVKEAQVMINFMLENINKLTAFPFFQKMIEQDILGLHNLLWSITIAETTSKNTVEEFNATMQIFKNHGVELIVDVTSPTHASRCMRDAIDATERAGVNLTPSRGVVVMPAETHYSGYSISDVVISEPPHRGDSPQSFRQFHALAKRLSPTFFKGDEQKRGEILGDLVALISKYGG
ncbi:MAG: hypothetical protein Q7S34_03775 [bacterium]|nr:hypothetical protein [bacterium]